MLFNLKLKNLLVISLIMIMSGLAYSQDAPLLSEPSNNATCKLPSVAFVWLTANGAVNYTIQISESSSFSTLVDSKTQSEVTFTSTKLTYNKTYYWKVAANYVVNNVNVSTWAVAKTFSTKNLPIQISPINGATCQAMTITLDWAQPAVGDTFQLQIDTDQDFINTIYDEVLYTNSKTITLPDYDRTYYWRVKSFKELTCPNEWTPVYSFKTTRIAPTPLNPPNNVSAISMTPTLNWSNIPAGLAYEVQVSTNSAFTGTLVFDEVTTDPNFAIDQNLNYNTKYYWRVKVKYADCYSDFSSVFSFTTIYASPKLVAPTDFSSCISMNPKLVWRKIVGNAKYKVQVNTINDFKYPIIEVANIADTTLNVTLPKGLQKYYWRVVAEDQNNKGEYSLVSAFQTTYKNPDHLFPQNNVGAIKRAITFKWEKSADNLKYSLQVSKKADYSTLIVNDTAIQANEFTTFLNDFHTTYYWRVKVADTLCSSDWSDSWAFTTELSAPTLSTPLNQASKQQLFLACTWIPVTGATAYHYQCAEDSTFAKLFYGSFSALTPTGLEQLQPNKKYWWRVRSADKFGTSDWSAVYTFTTGSQGPEIVSLLSPANATVKAPLTQELKWNASARANYYRIQFSDKANFSTILKDSTNIKTLSYTVSNLTNFTSYFWRVYAINDSGTAKASPTWEFRTIAIAPAAAPVLKTPADKSKDLDISVNFVWYTVDRATDYEIQISLDEAFTSPIKRVLGNNTTRRDDLEFEKNYYWRVKGINEAGETSWSNVWTFTTQKFVSVNEEYFVGKLEIYPNPTIESSVIDLKLSNSENADIQLIDLNGNLISNIYNGDLSSGNHQIRVNTHNLSSGNYFVKIQLGKNTTYRKLVINK